MKNFLKIIAISALAIAATGCTIVDTGKVGLRKNFNNTIESTELQAGSMNQTIIGKVIEFPVRDVSAKIDNLTPLSSDNSTMADVDFTVIYNINPSCVSDLYVNKSREFHHVDEKDGDTYLMKAYIEQTARNVIYKVTRGYEAMTMNDKRAEIERDVKQGITDSLAADKLGSCITTHTIQARALVPSTALRQAADDLVRAKTANLAKAVEVDIAKKESERIAALNANAGAINYMNASANMKIAEAVLAGKVGTIIMPYDFKGIVNAGK